MESDTLLAMLVIAFVEQGEPIGWAGPLLIDEDLRREEEHGIPSIFD